MLIRKFRSEDKPEVRHILIKTSRLPVETEKDIKLLELLYNDYYTECEPQHCFVAADENDKAVGYIICASDYKEFLKKFRKFYLPEIKELGYKYYFQAIVDIFGHALNIRHTFI